MGQTPMRLELKSDEQISKMRAAGLVVAEALEVVKKKAAPGVTTKELADAAAEAIAAVGATPSFLGYGEPPFPAVVCLSVNDEIVHGVPGDRVLQAGDIVSADCGAIVDGWHGDAAMSVVIPGDDSDVAKERQQLSDVTHEALWSGIAAMSSAVDLNDIGGAIEDTIDDSGLGYEIVEDYTGHGIGTQMHMEPEVFNYRVEGDVAKVETGLVIAIEPMVVTGDVDTKVLSDEWTVSTQDGSSAAHWEHTVAVTSKGLWVLTAKDGGKAELEARGVTYGPAGGR